ncbi:MAG: 2-polyprenyl-3-methyl-6-methoxy-1,4-benzoquinone monooxygenase [Gammaproteobacteria bacterium]|nr:2-polyprenyl-3-methyl-6-methoxy-1,4-benzoquinone monooxygenase [Gammaproteobacteria bacterium]
MSTRHYSPLDQLLIHVDRGVRTVFGQPPQTERLNPATGLPEAELSEQQRRHVAGLMRVNHAGEVAAQGLYQGQALTARSADVRASMARAADEENDHLTWCQGRVHDLDQGVSVLNPLWYLGSLAIGAAAGVVGDKWSLGFVVETERQVVRHLDQHLQQLPSQDHRSRAILEQMRTDEQHHATLAHEVGAAELPPQIKSLMTLASKVMTKTAYWI